MELRTSSEDELIGKVLLTSTGDVVVVKGLGDCGDVKLAPFLLDPVCGVETDIREILGRPHVVLTPDEAEKLFAVPLACMREAGLLSEATTATAI